MYICNYIYLNPPKSVVQTTLNYFLLFPVPYQILATLAAAHINIFFLYLLIFLRAKFILYALNFQATGASQLAVTEESGSKQNKGKSHFHTYTWNCIENYSSFVFIRAFAFTMTLHHHQQPTNGASTVSATHMPGPQPLAFAAWRTTRIPSAIRKCASSKVRRTPAPSNQTKCELCVYNRCRTLRLPQKHQKRTEFVQKSVRDRNSKCKVVEKFRTQREYSFTWTECLSHIYTHTYVYIHVRGFVLVCDFTTPRMRITPLSLAPFSIHRLQKRATWDLRCRQGHQFARK